MKVCNRKLISLLKEHGLTLVEQRGEEEEFLFERNGKIGRIEWDDYKGFDQMKDFVNQIVEKIDEKQFYSGKWLESEFYGNISFKDWINLEIHKNNFERDGSLFYMKTLEFMMCSNASDFSTLDILLLLRVSFFLFFKFFSTNPNLLVLWWL